MNSQEELRDKILAINERINFLINKFTLTQEINKLMVERAQLQEKCTHEFENHTCKWCGIQEVRD